MKRAGGDGKVKRKTSVSREDKRKQQPTAEVRLDASLPTPPPSEDVTAESSPREAVNFSSLSLDKQDQEQQKEGPPLPPMTRRVSFNEVVKVCKPPPA